MKPLTLLFSVFICVQPWLNAPAAASGPTEPQVGGLIDLPMYTDPVLTPPEEVDDFHPRLGALWLAALDRPDAELRREAAVAFGRAGRDGMAVAPAARDRLIETMKTDADPAARVAAAEALHELNHAESAPAMLDVNREADDVELIRATDRALADWRHQPAASVWIARVEDPAGLDAVRRSAMRALGEVPVKAAFAPLAAVATDADAPLALRLEAGRAAGKLLKANVITSAAASDAAAALVTSDRDDQRVAAAMLAVQRDDAPPPATDSARAALLARLLGSRDPTVVAAAIEALASVDPARMQARFDQLARSPDASVRLAAVHANISVAPDDRSAQVQRLIRWLDDPGVRVRHAAREQLMSLANAPPFAELVRQAVMTGLGVEGWRGVEQAALLAGALDHEPAADRLIELLRHDRAEVRLAAAAALRLLAVADTLPAMLKRAQQLAAQSRTADSLALIQAIDHETAQLFMAFGQQAFAPAETLMRQYIPKATSGSQARAAAVYALGKLHEDNPDPSLIRAFAGRLSDINPMNPELNEVRRFAAIGLGRMNAKRQLGVLRRFLEEENSSVDIGGATRWAIIRITGEQLPPLQPIVNQHMGWFLEPAE